MDTDNKIPQANFAEILTDELKKDAKHVLSGKFTFVIIGPSQHGKTTFLREMLGVTDDTAPHTKVGTGQESVTTEPHIWTQASSLAAIKVQFIDTPGLGDSRDQREHSDELIKAKVSHFLTANNPQCVLLFHKFLAELTKVSTIPNLIEFFLIDLNPFHASVGYAKEIAQLYKCPVLMIHTYCDGDGYPKDFSNERLKSDEIQSLLHSDKQAAKRALSTKCFTDWKCSKEGKVQQSLGTDIKFSSACSVFNFLGNELPDGTNTIPGLVSAISEVMGSSILLLAYEYSKNQSIKKAAEDILSKVDPKLLVVGGVTAATAVTAATVATVATATAATTVVTATAATAATMAAATAVTATAVTAATASVATGATAAATAVTVATAAATVTTTAISAVAVAAVAVGALVTVPLATLAGYAFYRYNKNKQEELTAAATAKEISSTTSTACPAPDGFELPPLSSTNTSPKPIPLNEAYPDEFFVLSTQLVEYVNILKNLVKAKPSKKLSAGISTALKDIETFANKEKLLAPQNIMQDKDKLQQELNRVLAYVSDLGRTYQQQHFQYALSSSSDEAVQRYCAALAQACKTLEGAME